MDTCVRCQLTRTIRLGNVEECCNFSEVSTEFFSLKKVALKLRYEKNVRGRIWGGHDGTEF